MATLLLLLPSLLLFVDLSGKDILFKSFSSTPEQLRPCIRLNYLALVYSTTAYHRAPASPTVTSPVCYNTVFALNHRPPPPSPHHRCTVLASRLACFLSVCWFELLSANFLVDKTVLFNSLFCIWSGLAWLVHGTECCCHYCWPCWFSDAFITARQCRLNYVDWINFQGK